MRIPPELSEPSDQVWASFRPIHEKDDAGRHFHFITHVRCIAIPGVRHSTASDTVCLTPGHGALGIYVGDTL